MHGDSTPLGVRRRVSDQIPSAWGVDGGWDQHPISGLHVPILPAKHCPRLSFQIQGWGEMDQPGLSLCSPSL